jgi:PTS system mannose-specific IIA component
MVIALGSEPLVGVVVVTHGSSGACLLDAAGTIVGTLVETAAVGVSMDEPFDDVIRRVEQACGQVDGGAGIVILVDIHGSSPFQACMAMVDGTRPLEIVCGVNLPMLIKLATIDRRELRPAEMAELLRDVGRRSIRLGSELTGKVALQESR